MDKTETSLFQKNWSQSDDEAENYKRRKDLDVSLPFCFVTIWPNNNATPQDIFKEAINMFKKKDQRHLQQSEKIREKVLERERVIGRLEEQKGKLRKLKWMIGGIVNAKRALTEDVDDNHAVRDDELMEKKEEEKQALEAKIKEVEKEFEDVKEEIWCHMDHLKEKHHRNEASVFLLDRKKVHGKDRWFFMFCNLESTHAGFTSMNTSSYTL